MHPGFLFLVLALPHGWRGREAIPSSSGARSYPALHPLAASGASCARRPQDLDAGHPRHRRRRLSVQLRHLAHRRRPAVGGDARVAVHARRRLWRRLRPEDRDRPLGRLDPRRADADLLCVPLGGAMLKLVARLALPAENQPGRAAERRVAPRRKHLALGRAAARRAVRLAALSALAGPRRHGKHVRNLPLRHHADRQGRRRRRPPRASRGAGPGCRRRVSDSPPRRLRLAR